MKDPNKEEKHVENPQQTEETRSEAQPVVGKEREGIAGQQQTSDAPYSVHSVGKRRLIVLAASLAGFFSPLSASIYYPALTVIAKDFNVTNTQVNLTVTTYLIFQGVAPMITAEFSDTAGRRPAYAICFILYNAANLGLALQNSESYVRRSTHSASNACRLCGSDDTSLPPVCRKQWGNSISQRRRQ
jgi:hypothetical protein